MRSDYPEYAEAIRFYLSGETSRLQKILKNGSLGALEKRLIQARSAMAKSDQNLARSLLTDISETGVSEFLVAELHFVRAQVEFSSGDYESAVIDNTCALEIYARLHDRRGQFLCHYNLGVDYSRLKLWRMGATHYERAALFADSESEHCSVERTLICELSRSGQNVPAAERMKNLEPRFTRLGGPEEFAHLTVAFDIYVRAEMLVDAARTAARLKRNKRGLERARIELDEALLKVLLDQEVHVSRLKPLLAPHAEHRWQWELVEALRSGALSEAEKIWARLATQFPRRYGDFLEPSSNEDRLQIFFTALRKFRNRGSAVEARGSDATGTSRLKHLYDTLAQSPTPLRKEEIIEKVWGVSYDPGYDNRFYKLLERFRRGSPGVAVVCAKRAYSLRTVQ